LVKNMIQKQQPRKMSNKLPREMAKNSVAILQVEQIIGASRSDPTEEILFKAPKNSSDEERLVEMVKKIHLAQQIIKRLDHCHDIDKPFFMLNQWKNAPAFIPFKLPFLLIHPDTLCIGGVFEVKREIDFVEFDIKGTKVDNIFKPPKSEFENLGNDEPRTWSNIKIWIRATMNDRERLNKDLETMRQITGSNQVCMLWIVMQ